MSIATAVWLDSTSRRHECQCKSVCVPNDSWQGCISTHGVLSTPSAMPCWLCLRINNIWASWYLQHLQHRDLDTYKQTNSKSAFCIILHNLQDVRKLEENIWGLQTKHLLNSLISLMRPSGKDLKESSWKEETKHDRWCFKPSVYHILTGAWATQDALPPHC